MTLATTIAKKVYTTDDVTTAFPFPYKFYETSDLVVTKYTIADGTEEPLAEDDDYTVVGGDDGEGGTTDYSSGGTINLVSAAGSGYKLIIERVFPLTQEYNITPNGSISEASLEEALDRVMGILQQQQSDIDRCIKMDKSNSSVSSVFDVEDLTVEIPSFVIDELTTKTTIGTNDYVSIADGNDSNVNKKILASSIINIHGLTEDTSLHANDVFLFEDSQASYVKKKVKRDNLLNINSLTEKTALANADLIIIEDSDASNVKKKVQAMNVQPINTLTEKTSLVDDDLFVIEDSEASNAKKKVKKSNLGRFAREAVLTGSGNWTVPTGVTMILLTMTGGGGGGGGSNAQNYSASGGGAGGTLYGIMYPVTPGATIAYVVGAGGAAIGAGVWTDGNDGAATTFGPFTAAGGLKGLRANSSAPAGGAAGGNPTGEATLGVAGTAGAAGTSSPASGGNGGASFWAAGGVGQTAAVGGSGSQGSGGAGAEKTGNYGSGAGGNGVIKIKY